MGFGQRADHGLRHAPHLTDTAMKSIYALLTVIIFASPVFAQAPAVSSSPAAVETKATALSPKIPLRDFFIIGRTYFIKAGVLLP